jgi:hypothetical protein
LFPQNDNLNNQVFSIASLAFQVRSAIPLSQLAFKRFQMFRSQANKGNILIRVHLTSPRDLTEPPLDPEDDPRLAPAGRRGLNSKLLRSRQVQSHLEGAMDHTDRLFVEMHSGAISIFDFEDNCADFFFLAGSAPDPGQRWFGPAMLALFLPKFDALLLHASAIVRHGRAAVFLAPDEGGKTTAVRLSPSGTIIGDDQVLVRRFGDGYRVFGTPWGLHIDAKLQAPLGGLFLLEKADRFALAPLSCRELVFSIWEETKNPISILPKELKKKVFGFVCEIAAAVPAWRMSFPKDHIDWEAIDRALATPVNGFSAFTTRWTGKQRRGSKFALRRSRVKTR